MNNQAGMIGYVELFGFMALVGLPCLGALVASKHHRPMWIGLSLGVISFVAGMSGWLVALMIKDNRDREKYPNRIGLSRPAKVVTIAVFACAAAGSVWLFHWIREG